MIVNSVLTRMFYTNAYILTDEKTGVSAIVDPGEWNNELEKACCEVGLENIKYILLTHGHFDHIYGLDSAKKKTGALVAISEDDAKMLENADENASKPLIGVEIVCDTKPDILLHDGDELELGDLRIKVIATPGHTAGGVCFLCDDTLFSGDTMFCCGHGRTDLYGGDEHQLMMSFRKLCKLPDDYKVYPGHDIPTTIGHERTQNSFMRMR